MTLALQRIIDSVRHTNDVEIGWHSVGGRTCPLGWWDCSQPVYESNCGQYTDHGERGGPGDTFCRTECHHGHQPPDEPELSFGEPEPTDAAGVPAVGHSTKPRHTLGDSPGGEKE
jgi:hypothetical protein